MTDWSLTQYARDVVQFASARGIVLDMSSECEIRIVSAPNDDRVEALVRYLNDTVSCTSEVCRQTHDESGWYIA